MTEGAATQTCERADILGRAAPDAAAEPAWAAVAQLLADRYSCRAFKPDPIPRDVLRDLFVVNQMSASWCNSQPWQAIVTSGAETERFRAALTEHAENSPGARATDFPFPEAYVGVFDERRKGCAWQLYDAVGVTRGDRVASRRQTMENFRLFGAPHVAILTTEKDLGVYGAIDCGIYLGNLLLAAQSRGIATIAQASLAMVGPFVRDYFDIPPDRLIICGVSMGYADHAAAANSFRTDRAVLDDVVDWRGA